MVPRSIIQTNTVLFLSRGIYLSIDVLLSLCLPFPLHAALSISNQSMIRSFFITSDLSNTLSPYSSLWGVVCIYRTVTGTFWIILYYIPVLLYYTIICSRHVMCGGPLCPPYLVFRYEVGLSYRRILYFFCPVASIYLSTSSFLCVSPFPFMLRYQYQINQ